MSLLSRNNRGLLGQGPLAVMQAAQQRRAAMLKPQAPRVIPAGTTVIREADPLRGFSEGMAKLATGLFGDPKVRANREAMSAAMAPEDVTKTVTTPGGFRVPGPAGATPVYQDVVDPDDPNAASLRQTLKDPAMAQSAAEMTGTRYVPDKESQVTTQAPASYSTVVARLNEAGRPDLARSYLSSKAAEASLSSNERDRLTAERDQEIRREASILYADNKTQEAVAKLLQLSGNNAVTQAVAQSLNKPPKQPKRYMQGALTFDADGTPVINKEVLAIQTKMNEQKAENKAMTEGQAKAAGYAIRMNTAMGIIDELGDFGTTARGGAEAVASDWGLGSMTSEDSQVYQQAKANFINAVLRRESGAVISDTEFAKGDRQYFPKFGDKEQNIRNKAQNRADTLAGLMVGAGKSFRLPPRVPRYRVVSETGSRASSTAGEPWKRTKSFSYEDEAKAGFDGVELDERELRALNRSN
jgi:hypothetical protein